MQMTLAEALAEYGELVIINGNGDPDQFGYIFPLTATTMAFEGR